MFENLSQILSKDDAFFLLDLITRSLACSTSDAFISLVSDMKRLIPFDHALAFMAQLNHKNCFHTYEIINISYPSEWLEIYILKGMAAIDPLVKENFRLYKFQNWEETQSLYPDSGDFFQKAARFGLTRGYSHGIRLPASSEGSMFSFAGDSVELLPRTQKILQIIVPHLHNALSSVIHRRPLADLPHLTARETEILKWIGAGKSSWEASIILGISESTVNFHIKNILDKLGVGTRAQAIGMAVKAGLVDLGMP